MSYLPFSFNSSPFTNKERRMWEGISEKISLLKTKIATSKITVIITRYKGTESCGLPRNKENKMVKKPHPNTAASKEDHMAQGTKTRWQRSPLGSAFPLQSQFPGTGTVWGSSQPAVTAPLLLFGQTDPVGLGPAVPSCCCFVGKEKPHPWPQQLQLSTGAAYCEIPSETVLDWKKCSFLETCARQLPWHLSKKQERGLCACSLSLKGIPRTSCPCQNLPLQGETLRVHFWPPGLKGTLTQTTWIDVEEKWNTIHIFLGCPGQGEKKEIP